MPYTKKEQAYQQEIDTPQEQQEISPTDRIQEIIKQTQTQEISPPQQQMNPPQMIPPQMNPPQMNPQQMIPQQIPQQMIPPQIIPMEIMSRQKMKGEGVTMMNKEKDKKFGEYMIRRNKMRNAYTVEGESVSLNQIIDHLDKRIMYLEYKRDISYEDDSKNRLDYNLFVKR